MKAAIQGFTVVLDPARDEEWVGSRDALVAELEDLPGAYCVTGPFVNSTIAVEFRHSPLPQEEARACCLEIANSYVKHI